jgi:hypothetical protein
VFDGPISNDVGAETCGVVFRFDDVSVADILLQDFLTRKTKIYSKRISIALLLDLVDALTVFGEANVTQTSFEVWLTRHRS